MESLSERVEALQNLLIAHATGVTADPNEYKKLRQEIVNDLLLKDIAPRFLRTCRTTAEFWQFIKYEYQLPYENDSDLPGLYKIVAKTLNLAPSQHSETIFRQILGGCTAVVEGLGALRNRLSDAHGQGKKAVKPAARHAELAVNLAGSVAIFLVATHLALPVVSSGNSTPS